MKQQSLPQYRETSLSIIIPTYNRRELLRQTIDSLCALEFPINSQFEIIICDDGSSDSSLDAVRAFEQRLNIKYCYQPDKGFRAAAARNMGIKLAQGKIILFLDCGLIATPNLAKEHLLFHSLYDNDTVVMGPMNGHHREGSDLWQQIRFDEANWWNKLDVRDFLLDPRITIWQSTNFKIDHLTAPWSLLWGGNFSVSKEHLVSVGGFDESFTEWGAEDVDLGYRLHKNNLRFLVNLDALSIHLPHEHSSRSRESELLNRKRIYKKDPQLITELLACCSLRQYSEEVDEIRAVVQQSLIPDYSQIWDADTLSWFKQQGVLECVLGGGSGEIAAFLNCKLVLDPDQVKVTHLRIRYPWITAECCLGVNTMLSTQAINMLLITDFWRAFTERAVVSLIQEAARIARRVLILYTPMYIVPQTSAAPTWDIDKLFAPVTDMGYSLKSLHSSNVSTIYEISPIIYKEIE